jgi:hypothetical protein
MNPIHVLKLLIKVKGRLACMVAILLREFDVVPIDESMSQMNSPRTLRAKILKNPME